MKKASFTLMLGTILCAGNVWASNCVQMPDCQSLGFTKTESECKDKLTIFCPSDTSKAFCSSGTKEEEKTQAPLPILYGDGTVSKEYPLSGKTPIGIVFDETNKLAIALTDIKEDGSAGSQTMKWSEKLYDIPNLENFTGNTGTNSTAILCTVDGRVNTDKILTCGSNCGGTPVATAVNSYQPINCTKDFCKKGKWFLPSIRDLNNVSKIKGLMDEVLATIEAQEIKGVWYWSSVEFGIDSALIFMMTTGNTAASHKFGDYSYTRPVIYYGTSSSWGGMGEGEGDGTPEGCDECGGYGYNKPDPKPSTDQTTLQGGGD